MIRLLLTVAFVLAMWLAALEPATWPLVAALAVLVVLPGHTK